MSRWAIAVLLLATGATGALAGEVGRSGGQFLLLGAGARPAAMGGAFTAAATGADALHWNPAGLAQPGRSEVLLMYSPWFEGINYSHISYAHGEPVLNGRVGAALTLADYGEFEQTQINGQNPVTGLGSVAANDLSLDLGYAATGYGFDYGVGLKYIRSSMANVSASAFAVDAGVRWRDGLMPGLTLGAAVLNLGSDLKFDGQAADLPLTFKAGAAYYCPNLPLLVTGDLIIPNDDKVGIAIGAEYTLAEQFALRLGYSSDNDAGSGLTAGCGWQPNADVSVDYAFVPYGDLGNAHRIAMAYRFGGPPVVAPLPPAREVVTPQPRAVLPAAPPAAAPSPMPAYAGMAINVPTLPPQVPARPAQALIELGNAAEAAGDYQGAIQFYLQSLQQEPNSYSAYYNLGNAIYRINDFSGARDAFAYALQLKPGSVEAMNNLGGTLYKLHDYAGAARNWEAVLARDPGNVAARANLEKVYQRHPEVRR